MTLCASCKNKTSLEQCTSLALKGLLFCGKHIKCRQKRIWSVLNGNNDKAILIQAIWRGHFVRTKLRLAGPGVLNRKDCHNTDELVTMDDKLHVHPLDYFAFMEADKLYWFDIRSLYQITRNNLRPLNPYTRQPLNIETRRRLRRLCQIRKRERLFNLYAEPVYSQFSELVDLKWLEVCQIIEENGFEEVNHLLFASLNKTQLYIFINLIQLDLIAYAAEHKTLTTCRNKYMTWMKTLISKFAKYKYATLQASYNVSRALLSILNDSPEPYTLCFIIISAVVRL
jgi:hypothetical protein